MQVLAAASPELRERAAEVRDSVVGSCAPATARVYSGWFQQFGAFCHRHRRKLHQVSAAEVALFLQELINAKRAASSINQAAAAIAWHYQIADKWDPTKHSVVAKLLAKAKRVGPPIKHKEPSLLEHLAHLQRYTTETGTFVSARTYVLSLALYASCSRLDDLREIKREVVEFRDNYVYFHLPQTKTASVQEGDEKFMAAAEHTTMCPVEALKRWMARADVGKRGTDALFPAHDDVRRPISKTTFSENLKTAQSHSKLKRVVPHGFRAGAATAAVSNNLPVEDLMLCGSWKDPRSISSYVRRNPQRRVEAARSFSL